MIQTPLAVTAPAPIGASSVSVNADPLLPLITINATAPSPKQAAALANGSVTVLQSYIQTVAAEEGIPTSRRPVITSLGSAVGLPSTSGPSKMYSAIAIVLLFGLSCYVILLATGGKARLRELRAIEYERALALVSSTGEPRGPIAPPVSDAAPTRAATPVDSSSPSLAHLRQFDAGAGLLTVSDDLGRARAATDEASALEESHADAASRTDTTHGEFRSETNRSTHASPHHRKVRSAPSQTLFSRFSRS